MFKKLNRPVGYLLPTLLIVGMLVGTLLAIPSSSTFASGETIVAFNSTPVGGKWTVPIGVTSVKVLVVAGGGGGGGNDTTGEGGGGGAGGFIYNATYTVIPEAELTVTVGDGGAGASSGQGTNGSNSVFDILTAIGGGGGGYYINHAGSPGGSGGGGGQESGAGGDADYISPRQGYDGGAGSGATYHCAGGGGGASVVGANGGAAGGGKGGNGTACSISGSSVYYAGGGGGSTHNLITAVAPGGLGGGGAGAGKDGGGPIAAVAGTVNTGGGGGGGGELQVGMAGGSGLVIVSYETPGIVIPTVTTQEVSGIGTTYATGNGNITDTGGENCTSRGFCYMEGTSGDPTTSSSIAYDSGSFGNGSYTKVIASLSPDTSYRVRAYAINSAGTGYGTTVQLLTEAVIYSSGAYRSEITIIDISVTDRIGVPALVPFGTAQAIDFGYLSSTCLDTRMFEGTTEGLYMVADDKIGVFIPSLIANQQRQYRFETGYSPANPSFGLITGNGGNVTVADSATLGLANNFIIEQDGYVNTSVVGNLSYKQNVIRTYVSGTGNITSSILGVINWTSPTGYEDADSKWGLETYAYDDAFGVVGAEPDIPASSWGSFLNLTITATNCSKLRFYTSNSYGFVDLVDLDVYYSSAWHDVYNGTFTDGMWIDKSLGGTYSVTKARIKFHNTATYPSSIDLLEFDFGCNETATTINATATGISGGEHIIKVMANGTIASGHGGYLSIWIDGTQGGSTSLGNWSVATNSTNWKLIENNVMPYMNYTSITVNGVQKLLFQPNTIISGTTLVDRVGSNNGTIAWGSNSNLTIVVGGLKSMTTYISAPTEEGELPVVLPLPGNVTLWEQEEEITTIGWLPFDLIQPAAVELGWTTNTLYEVLMIFAAIMIGVGVAVATGSALLAVIATGIGLAVGASTGGVGWWIPIVYAIFSSAYLVASRSM